MKNKTKLFMNITFIVGAFLTIFSVCFFNFIVDPYFIFRNRDHMDLTLISKEYYQAMLKAYKNNHADTVFIGSSLLLVPFLLFFPYVFSIL